MPIKKDSQDNPIAEKEYESSTISTCIIINSLIMLKILRNFATELGNQQNNMKRFYKQASFRQHTDKAHPFHKYIVVLDGKTIKTPYQNILAVPSPALAFLISNQFNRQQKHLKTAQMPLLALSRTAVDADIEGHLAQHLKSSIYQYLKTDTLLFKDEAYSKDYEQYSRPLVERFNKKFETNYKQSQTIYPPIVQISQSFKSWVDGLSNWELIGMETMTIWMKSTIAAYNIIDRIQSDHKFQDIQTAGYLQQIAQMRSSGEVQQKIMDINQIRLMVSCGEMLYRFGKSQ